MRTIFIVFVFLIILTTIHTDVSASELYRLEPDENAITTNGTLPLHVEISLANLTNNTYSNVTEPIDNVTFWFSASGYPTGDIYIQLHKVDYSFVAESNHVSASSITSYTPLTFEFSDTPVCGTVTCYFSIHRTNNNGTVNLIYSNVEINGSEIGSIEWKNIGTGADDGVYMILNGKQQENFYSQIKNTSNGTLALKSNPEISSPDIKILPEDWIVYVDSDTTVIADGYKWYKITDPTDDALGWMTGYNIAEDFYYLSYDGQKQTEFASISGDYIAISSRPDLILEAIDHYYNNEDTTHSLYSSDDGNNHISVLKDRGYEKKVLWGIAARESGGDNFGFNNEIVSFDYGHGIMQLTFNAWRYEPENPHATWDNRGIGSKVKIPLCSSVNTNAYIDCYISAGTGNRLQKPYKNYKDNLNNPIYKQYANTKQSIYSNIKDGLKTIQYKYANFYQMSTDISVNGVTYKPKEREIILVTSGYNGKCGYVNDVANNLDKINFFFPNVSSVDISDLIGKMHSAGKNEVCTQLYSPVDLVIQDPEGKKVGVENGQLVNDFPMAIYDKDMKFAKILSPETDDYNYIIYGTDNGTYSMDINVKNDEELYELNLRNISININEIHTYSIDIKTLNECKDGIKIKIDANGDGKADRVLKSRTTLSKDIFYNDLLKGEIKVSSNKNKCKHLNH